MDEYGGHTNEKESPILGLARHIDETHRSTCIAISIDTFCHISIMHVCISLGLKALI